MARPLPLISAVRPLTLLPGKIKSTDIAEHVRMYALRHHSRSVITHLPSLTNFCVSNRQLSPGCPRNFLRICLYSVDFSRKLVIYIVQREVLCALPALQVRVLFTIAMCSINMTNHPEYVDKNKLWLLKTFLKMLWKQNNLLGNCFCFYIGYDE